MCNVLATDYNCESAECQTTWRLFSPIFARARVPQPLRLDRQLWPRRSGRHRRRDVQVLTWPICPILGPGSTLQRLAKQQTRKSQAVEHRRGQQNNQQQGQNQLLSIGQPNNPASSFHAYPRLPARDRVESSPAWIPIESLPGIIHHVPQESHGRGHGSRWCQGWCVGSGRCPRR
jgi:hypothetical protein